MKEVTLKYGGISGGIMAALLFIFIPLASRIGFDITSTILLIGEIGALIPVYFGIKLYRQTIGDGYITMWKAFSAGIFITVIASILYSLAWLILYYWITPDFMEKYFQYFIAQAKLHGMTAKELATAQTLFEESQKTRSNPLVNFAEAFSSDQLLYGVIMTLVFAVILKKKPPTMEISNLN